VTVLHLIPHFGHGGDWVVVRTMAAASAASGDAVWINGLSADEALDPLGRRGNPLPLNRGARGLLVALWRLRHIPRGTDVLHAHSPICILFALLARAWRCPRAAIVFTFHWPVPDHGLRRSLKGRLFRSCDQVQACSSEIRRILLARYGVEEARVRLIFPGISAERFQTPAAAAARASGERRRSLAAGRVIGYVGRLAPEKNVSYLIRFFHEHLAQYPDIHLAIAGAGDLDAQLRREAAEGPAASRIQFLGYVHAPESAYPAFDLLVLPSSFEAFALVVVEAAFCGVPALRSDTEGCRDQIEHGVSGFLYSRAGGYDAMRGELRRILDEDWPRLPQMGEAARRRCQRLCDLEAFQRGLDRLYADAGNPWTARQTLETIPR
jgi:glycosyltransferase involved in cell wall biosynthesis